MQLHLSSVVLKKRLAWEVTKIVHGEERVRAAEQATRVLFGGESFNPSDDEVLSILSTELPRATTGQLVADILVVAEIVKSKGEARRLISGRAISINGQKIDEDMVVKEVSLIKKGKNTFIIVA